jgi:hypothetical protein
MPPADGRRCLPRWILLVEGDGDLEGAGGGKEKLWDRRDLPPDEGHLFPQFSQDLLSQGFVILRRITPDGEKGETIKGDPPWRESIQTAAEFVSLVPYDGDERVNVESLDGLLIGIAPIDRTLGMTVPPKPKGREVSPLPEGLEQVVRHRLRFEFGFRMGCPLADEKDVGHQEILSEWLHCAKPAHLEGAESDIQL